MLGNDFLRIRVVHRGYGNVAVAQYEVVIPPGQTGKVALRPMGTGDKIFVPHDPTDPPAPMATGHLFSQVMTEDSPVLCYNPTTTPIRVPKGQPVGLLHDVPGTHYLEPTEVYVQISTEPFLPSINPTSFNTEDSTFNTTCKLENKDTSIYFTFQVGVNAETVEPVEPTTDTPSASEAYEDYSVYGYPKPTPSQEEGMRLVNVCSDTPFEKEVYSGLIREYPALRAKREGLIKTRNLMKIPLVDNYRDKLKTQRVYQLSERDKQEVDKLFDGIWTQDQMGPTDRAELGLPVFVVKKRTLKAQTDQDPAPQAALDAARKIWSFDHPLMHSRQNDGFVRADELITGGATSDEWVVKARVVIDLRILNSITKPDQPTLTPTNEIISWLKGCFTMTSLDQ
ncbi:hypothetical protein TWF481_002986 [Arthrobotrys musiformis]|uniref:Uncharacterized protein n=1 Tax=Arthrobotrys musiformis TaxID=47236 RepID=A0AAV9VTS8_9PEZI